MKTEEKLVPDEIWDILVDDIIYIAADGNGEIWGYDSKPDLCLEYERYIDSGEVEWIGSDPDFYLQDTVGITFNLCSLKCLKNAQINKVDWKESVCERPKLCKKIIKESL